MDGRLGILSGAAFFGILAAGAVGAGLPPFDGDSGDDAQAAMGAPAGGGLAGSAGSPDLALTDTRLGDDDADREDDRGEDWGDDEDDGRGEDESDDDDNGRGENEDDD